MWRTQVNPHQNTCEGINTNKKLCRIGMEKPYGTMCEHVRSAMAHYLNNLSFVSLPSHWKAGFLRPNRLDRLDVSAGYPPVTVAYGHEAFLLYLFYARYGIPSP